MLVSNMLRFLDEPIDDFLPVFHILNNNEWPVRRRRQNLMWNQSYDLKGFEPKNVSIKQVKDENGEVKVEINARQECGEDFAEIRKNMKIPNNVDNEKLRSVLRKDGVLSFSAPYKVDESENEKHMEKLKPRRVARQDSWNGVWGEIDRLNSHMNEMIESFNSSYATSLPRSEVKFDEKTNSGTWKLKINLGKDFNAEDVTVKNLNNQIRLEARKEMKDGKSTSSRYLSEIVSIPEGVQQDELKCTMLENGEMIIEAPTNQLPSIENKENEGGKSIQIEKSSDNDKMTGDN